MDAAQIAVAETCLTAAHDGSLDFPQIVGNLIAAGFEGYSVDYRQDQQTFHLPSGDCLPLKMPASAGAIAAPFDGAEVARLIRWAQRKPDDYSYAAFSEKVKAAACASYVVSFLGRRVVYMGRSAEMHVEHFPD